MVKEALTRKRILRMPQTLANQIAAGEVVQRPACVLKELLENAIDAGSSEIEVHIARSGVSQLVVKDNGSGIDREDLPLSVTKHATSKLFSTTDLENIASLGFRGEALASIASVSRLEIISRPKSQEYASSFVVEGGRERELQTKAHHLGTTVTMRDLFYNVPARRHFLKSEKTEYQHLENMLKRLSVSAFGVGFEWHHNGKKIKKLPCCYTQQDKEKRVGQILGHAFMKEALYFDTERNGYCLSGWLGSPFQMRPQNDNQYFYVNNRLIRDKVLVHAISQAYLPWNELSRYPSFVLFLTTDPNRVDVNIHPTKSEVRFRESRLVHDFVYESLVNVLGNQQTFSLTQKSVHPLSSNTPNAKKSLELAKDSQQIQRLVFKDWVIVQEGGVLLVFNIEKVAVRYINDMYLNALKKNAVKTKNYLFPEVVEFSSDIELLKSNQQFFEKMGFCYKILEPATIKIFTIPQLFWLSNCRNVLITLVEILRKNKGKNEAFVQQACVNAFALHLASKTQDFSSVLDGIIEYVILHRVDLAEDCLQLNESFLENLFTCS